MVAAKKDSREWVFDEKEELPLEWINGIFSYIETGDTLFKTSLPSDYKNSQFPTTNEKILCKRSKIGLEGNFRNNQTNIGLDSGGNIKLWIYPNIAPFKGFNSLIIKATNGVQLRLILRNFTGSILYNQAITVTNNKAIFDLSNIEIGQLKDLKYCSVEILTNITNTTIENIDINYDLRDGKLTELFQKLIKKDDSNTVLGLIKMVDGIGSGIDSEYLGGKKYDKYASKIQSDTKKFSELVNGDYIVGYNHISSISGKFVTINLSSGDWISLDGYDFSHSDNFSGVFNSSYVESGMNNTEIDSCFTFEVQKAIPQDLSDVKNELLSKIGDKLNTGTFIIPSVTADTSATTNITMPSAASYYRCVFWSSSAVGAYFIQVQSGSGTTWTIRHRFEGTSTNRVVYYAWW